MKSKKRIAILDCNNFYVSCERAFDPSLNQMPTIVLSNNDGCIIARSQEIKKMGIKMGTPFFEIKDFVEENKIRVFSSNYNLYGDMSDRIMSIIQNICGKNNVEVYSIDEAFIDLTDINDDELYEIITNLKTTILRFTGIPVSIGVGPNKTLAKLCNYISKNDTSFNNTYVYESNGATIEKINNINIGEVWGIGRQWTKKLSNNQIKTIKQFKELPQKWIRKNLTVLGEKTFMELHEFYCYEFNSSFKQKKIINTSRSFGKTVSKYEYMEEALFYFSKTAIEKLKKNNLTTSSVTVYMLSDRFKEDFVYEEKKIKLDIATDNFELLWNKISKTSLDLYKNDIEYKKCGIMLSHLTSKEYVQLSIFEDELIKQNEKIKNLELKVKDEKKPWQLKKDFISPQYTTNWDHIPLAHC